ncbi:MAG: tyrosine-type recombinase/integrase [Pseudomonadota bacterium]
MTKEHAQKRRHHARNERIKRAYFAYLEEAKRMNPKSVDQVAAALSAFEASTGWKDFSAFHIEQARAFKRKLNEAINPETGNPLAKATIVARLRAVKAFFQWLTGQPGYRSKLTYADADYFNPTANDGRIAAAVRERPVPSVEQIQHAIERAPARTPLERRDRALLAFILLTGARDDAVASLKLRHIDLAARRIDQDAREVRTKNRKTYPTWFFPVGDEIETIVCEWVDELRTQHLFGPDDPLFPATEIGLSEARQFVPIGLKRAHWSNADPIRRIFRERFEGAGLPYFNPHSFRKTLAQLGERVCQTPEVFKAWSQNLGHEKVLTTFTSYGAVSRHRQAEIIADLRAGADGDILDAETLKIARALKRGGLTLS